MVGDVPRPGRWRERKSMVGACQKSLPWHRTGGRRDGIPGVGGDLVVVEEVFDILELLPPGTIIVIGLHESPPEIIQILHIDLPVHMPTAEISRKHTGTQR